MVTPVRGYSSVNLLVAKGIRTTEERRQEKDKPSQGTMVVGTQVGWGPGKFYAVIFAEAVVEGRKTKFYTPAVTLDVVPAYEIEIPSDLTVLEPPPPFKTKLKVPLRESRQTAPASIRDGGL